MKAAVLTVSDGVSAGEREDRSGEVLAELLGGEGYEVERRVVPDERTVIAEALRELAGSAQIVLTTGGTGMGPRDVTPEATRDVLDRLAPGIAEAVRAVRSPRPRTAFSPAAWPECSAPRSSSTFPGSPGGARDGFEVLRPALGHALELLAGEPTAHRQT